MSIILMNNDLYVSAATWHQYRFDMTEISDSTGSGATRTFGPPRWGLSISCDGNADLAQAAEWEVMVLGLEGSTNRLSAYDPGKRQPRGTMRGALTLGAPLARFATSAQIVSINGTLLKGDLLQIGTGLGTSMLVKVMGDVTAAAGVATVPIHPASRIAFASGTPVSWDHPRAYMRALNKSQSWTYEANTRLAGGFAIDLIEAFN